VGAHGSQKIQVLLRGPAAKWYDQAMRSRETSLSFGLAALNDIRIGAYSFETLPGDTGMDSIPVGDGSISSLGWTAERGDAQDHDDRTSLTCKNPIDLQANSR